MRRAKAPVRLNFAGGGTDLEPYASDYGSYILSAAVKLYCRAVCLDRPEGTNEIATIITAISGEHLRLYSDVAPTSGLGASASLFVAGLRAAYPSLDREQLALMALYLERKALGILGGNQDQYCAAYGGLLFLIYENSKMEVNSLNIPPSLSEHLILIYAGDRRSEGKDIIKQTLTTYNVKALHQQKQIAKEMRDCLTQNDLSSFGDLLNKSWLTKRELTPRISTPDIDQLYKDCLSFGAIGGTLMGAGNGGFFLFMDNPNGHGNLRENLVKQKIPFLNVEFDTEGVQLGP